MQILVIMFFEKDKPEPNHQDLNLYKKLTVSNLPVKVIFTDYIPNAILRINTVIN